MAGGEGCLADLRNLKNRSLAQSVGMIHEFQPPCMLFRRVLLPHF